MCHERSAQDSIQWRNVWRENVALSQETTVMSGLRTPEGFLGVRSTHHARSVFVPIVVQGDVGIDGRDVVLPADRKQHAGRVHERPEFILNSRLDTEEIKAGWSNRDRMAVQSAGNVMYGHKLEVQSKAAFFINDVFGDKSRIDDIALIGGRALRMAGNRIGVEHAAAEPKRFKIFPEEQSFGEGQ